MATAAKTTTTTKTKAPSRPTSAKAPQDRKPKAAASVKDGIVTATLDGLTFKVDARPAANLRLMRRIRANDMEAVLEFVERAFPEDVETIEEHFDLQGVDDYLNLFRRACEAANPNS